MKITAAESQVMEALWRAGPLSSEELVAQVGAGQGWGEATVKTLTHRLLRKKAIAGERSAGRYVYRPLIERAEYVQDESQTLLDRLFDGRLSPMVAHFAEHRKIEPEEIARLRKLIDALEGDDQ